jgi:(1->4)-alpha-D-glucan 1-alpha-D-glucosylmutase
VAGQQLVSLARELLETREDGRIKLYVTHRVLTYRREHPDLFLTGAYLPLDGMGSKHRHVCAFARQQGQHELIVVAPRFLTHLIPDPQTLPLGSQVWNDTWLALPADNLERRYHNLFTGEAVTPVGQHGKAGLLLGEVFANFPVALLEGWNAAYQYDP